MISPYETNNVFSEWRILFCLAASLVLGCAEPNGAPLANGRLQDAAANERAEPNLPSAHFFLNRRDLEAFRPGRSMDDVLEDIQWRGNFVMAAVHDGKNYYLINYQLFSTDPDGKAAAYVFGIFLDNKFEKLVEPPETRAEDMEIVDIDGTPASRPKPVRLADKKRLLTRAIDAKVVDIAELEREVKARPPTPSHVDPGLTIAYLLLGGMKLKATEEDLKRNAELRDQFNAARLRIGMTEAEVESILNAKPLETGRVEADRYKIYGSNETFNIRAVVRFSNILVLYKDGKVSMVLPVGSGSGWREQLGERIIDLSKR